MGSEFLLFHLPSFSGKQSPMCLIRYLRIQQIISSQKTNSIPSSKTMSRKKNISRKGQLDAYDGCSKLRLVWDHIASGYDAVFTPSVVDEVPVGIECTGDAVSPSPSSLPHFPVSLDLYNFGLWLSSRQFVT